MDTTQSFDVYEKGTRMTLHLADGASVEFEEGGKTDEGYHYSHTRYENVDGRIERQDSSRYCDCDGPGSDWANYWWVPCLGVNENGYPNWKRDNAGQRDIFAESMGY